MSRTTTLRWLLCTLFAVATVLTLAPPADTQPAPSASSVDGQRPGGRQRLHRLRERVLRKKVGLSDDKVAKVVAILDGRIEERRALEAAVRTSRRAIGTLFKEDSSDQAAFAQRLDELAAAHAGLAKLRDQQLTELREVLEPKEQAKLLRAMELVKRRMDRRRFRRR